MTRKNIVDMLGEPQAEDQELLTMYSHPVLWTIGSAMRRA